MEKLSEGWVDFYRYHCKEGFIDRWMGDCINDPNNPTKHNMQLNTVASYWRCDGGKWVSDREIGRNEMFPLLQMGEVFTAQEIWNELLIKYHGNR